MIIDTPIYHRYRYARRFLDNRFRHCVRIVESITALRSSIAFSTIIFILLAHRSAHARHYGVNVKATEIDTMARLVAEL